MNWNNLQTASKTRLTILKSFTVPVVLIGEKGEYIINEASPKKIKPHWFAEVKQAVVKRPPVQHLQRPIDNLQEAVHQWPVFPGGGEAFMKYLDQLGKEMTVYLPKGGQPGICTSGICRG